MKWGRRWEDNFWIGQILFRMYTAIIFLYVAGNELARHGYTGNIFTQFYGIAVMGWAIMPFFKIIMAFRRKRVTVTHRSNKKRHL